MRVLRARLWPLGPEGWLTFGSANWPPARRRLDQAVADGLAMEYAVEVEQFDPRGAAQSEGPTP